MSDHDALQAAIAANLQQLEEIDRIVAVFETLGKGVDRSRIAQYVRKARPIFTEWEKSPQARMNLDPVYLSAWHELRALYQIADTLDELAARNPLLRKRVVSLFLDPYHFDPRLSARGRDTQAELVAGALLEWAGFRPTWQESGPDWVIETVARRVPVEVKHVTSVTGLHKAVREGRRTLSKSGSTGILWLDVSYLITPPQHSWKCPDDRDFVQQMRRTMDGAVLRLWRKVRKRANSGGVDVAIFYAAIPVQLIASLATLRQMLEQERGRAIDMAELRAHFDQLQRGPGVPVYSTAVAEIIVHWQLCDVHIHHEYLDLSERLTEAGKRRAIA